MDEPMTALSGAERSRRYDESHRAARTAAQLLRKRARRETLSQYKLARGCMDCPLGTRWPAEALDFDHVRGAKVADLNRLVGSSGWPRIWAEVDKCEVVCANHHRTRTKERYQ